MENNCCRTDQECCKESTLKYSPTDTNADAPILASFDNSFQYELEAYAELVSNINSKLDKFKSIPETKSCTDQNQVRSSSEYFYTFNEKLQSLSALNSQLQSILIRLNEIL